MGQGNHTPSRQEGLAGNVVDYLFERCLRPESIDRPYLLSEHGNLSFGDLYVRTCRVAHLLRQCGVGVGDRVLFSVRDGMDFPALFLGIMKIGAVSLPINTYLKASDYAYYIADSAAKVVVIDGMLAPLIGPLLGDFPSLAKSFVIGEDHSGFLRWEQALEGQPDSIETVACRPDDMAFWLYSSGSTGDPKGVVHTHAHLYWATELFGLAAQGVSAQDVILCPPKMFFAFGLGNQVYFPLRAEASVVVDSNPVRPERVLEHILRHRPTLIVAVPTIFAGVLQLLRGRDPAEIRAAFARMRFSVSGGEVLPPSVLQAWHDLTGTEILDGVGTTEMTHMFMLNRPGAVVPGSCGRIVPGFSARLLDEQGNDVPEGEVGNLFVVGPSAAETYWNKPQKTAATMMGGGVITGDKCYRDSEGNYFYVGRNDDMLRVGGVWVSPAEVEATLAAHPDVLECAVIGVPDERQMIKPKAYVVLRSGAGDAALAEDMLAFLRTRLAHIKCPRWIQFMDALPKTATGKIQRFRLRESARPGA
jgi:benzoate-CoA ligase family protein